MQVTHSVCGFLFTAGVRVVAVARRRDKLEKLQQHMIQTIGIQPADFLPVVCDITKEAEVAALPKILVKRWPGAGIDILVNNAGLSRNDASLFAGATSSWVEMISTNVLGTCMCTREALQVSVSWMQCDTTGLTWLYLLSYVQTCRGAAHLNTPVM